MKFKSSVFLKLKRRELKVTQRDLAKYLGCTNGQYISNIERGICLLSPKLLKKTSMFLELSKLDAQVFGAMLRKDMIAKIDKIFGL